MLFLAAPVWAQIYGPLSDDALEVEVVGRQFSWIMRYPGADGVFGRTRPELVESAANDLGLDPK